MVSCSICGEAFWPAGLWREEWCAGCAVNFKDSQELRIHDESVPITERQRSAALRLATAHAREAEHQRYEVDCRAALQQLLGQEDGRG
jgi:hypothetical protein